MSTYEAFNPTNFAHPISDATVTRDWLRANNEAAARVQRGTSTPESRLAAARREYDLATSGAHMGCFGARESGLGFSAQAGRAGEDFGSDREGGGADDSYRYWNYWHEQAYGAGRAYERAIQEARFGRATGNDGADWRRGLRK